MEFVPIKFATLNQVASYLARQPYSDVAAMIAALDAEVRQAQEAEARPEPAAKGVKLVGE